MKNATCLTVAALTLAAATTGCIGKSHSFCMFNGILKWNKSASDNEWGNELIFLGLNIIPVYGISLFADVIVFNSIDFWTGENPLQSLVAGTDPQGNPYTITPNGDGTATLAYQGQTCTLTPTAEGIVASQDGAVIGTFARHGNLATFTAPDGTTRAMVR